MRILEISLDFLFHSVFPSLMGNGFVVLHFVHVSRSKAHRRPRGRSSALRYLASVDELKKTGQLTRRIMERLRNGQTAFSCGQKSKCRCNGDRYKERNDENENRAAFMRIYVA